MKSIGLSNFNARQVQKILDNCSIKPVVNQCEIHLYNQNEDLAKYCMERGVAMVAYTPLGNVSPRLVGVISSLNFDIVKEKVK